MPDGSELSGSGAEPQRMNDTLANRPRGRSKEMLRCGTYVTGAHTGARRLVNYCQKSRRAVLQVRANSRSSA
ncbi:protein of unknown function [Paraburkholderia dioscoreae]|uniref:Uncharacterized protein n=1 Tax=Paraburkholderia dioscoreae TaxID=2604047 RepID=A0A5Q4YVX0_9BURK|nr:protein of unknown function [Paraburkholderia dioscoreae]